MASELSNDQRKYLIDSAQMYESYIEAKRHADSYRHGMTWKRARGKEYLFRLSGRTGYGRSLGVRSPETEQIEAEFREGKARANNRLDAIKGRLDEFAVINKALRLGRVPNVVARILRLLDELNLLGQEFIVLGTQSLYAYEAAAGVRVDPSLTASGDVDLMFDTLRKIELVSQKLDGAGLIGLLRKVDKSFEPMQRSKFRAANNQEFMVDLIMPPLDMRDSRKIQFAEGDLIASEIPGLEWLMNAPKFEAICIGEDGWPTRFVVPDPRAFAIHKAWLSTRPMRDPLKKSRDVAQGVMVRMITEKYFPHLSFAPSAMQSFPKEMPE